MISREDAGWVLGRIWLNALEETARDFHGTYPKAFCDRAYYYASDNWIRALAEDYGLRVSKADSMRAAVENYIDLGVKAHLFRDQSDFTINEVSPNKLEIVINSCPYHASCCDLLGHGFRLEDFTCARLGCFSAAIRILAGIQCDHQVTGISLEEECMGFIHRV